MALALTPVSGPTCLLAGMLALAAVAHADPADQMAPDADAQFRIGLIYDQGRGVAPDAAEAYRWYQRAAQGEQVQAEFNVAAMNEAGRGTLRDLAEAALWYARAASHGMWQAEYRLAQLYEAGEGVPRNPEEALRWYEQAAPQSPIAAAKLHVIRPQIAAAPQGRLQAVSLPPPFATVSDELVWRATRQPAAVRYYVVVMSLDGPAPEPLFTGFSDRSALLVPGLGRVRSFAWRVYTVAVGAPHYAATPWQTETRVPRL